MRIILFTLVIVVAVVLAQRSTLENIKRIVDAVNKNPTAKWNATLNNDFASMTDEEVKRSLGTLVPQHSYHSNRKRSFTVRAVKHDIPTNFDSRTRWNQCTFKIRQRGNCGSCWAFSTAEVLGDRFCIETGENVQLSPQDLISCDTREMGCSGGYLPSAWSYMVTTGAVTEKCYPYVSGTSDTSIQRCPRITCPGETSAFFSMRKKKAKRYYSVCANEIEQEIMSHGPVSASMSVYRDFCQYSSGIYSYITGDYLGGLSVRIIGWGVSGSTPYWIAANSWGTSWGKDGYFWIKRGSDECGIEAGVYAGLPDV